MNLYQHALMDHYRHPHNRGTVNFPDFFSGHLNPSCGDKIAIQGIVTDNHLKNALFEGSGCVISQATASMLTDKVKDMPLADIMSLDKDAIIAMIGMELGPTRLKCALLPLQALHKGIAHYQAHKGRPCLTAVNSCELSKE